MRLCLADKPNGTRSATVATDEDAAAVDEWPVQRRTRFDDVGDLAGAPVGASTGYLAQKSNQSGFNAVMETGPTSLRFVQLTVANRHS